MNTNVHKTIGRITLTCFALLALALPNQTHAQFTVNNQTNIISGVTSNWPGDYYLGSNHVFDALFIRNSGVLSNASGFIGYGAGANSNLAIVSGSGSVWSNTYIFGVGVSCSGNALVISNGGKVVVTSSAFSTDSSFVGISSTGPASNNSVLVTGNGSFWSNRNDLKVGYSGVNLTIHPSVGNRLIISDGGAVINSNGYVGYVNYAFARASNNGVVVTGSGSVWNNSGNVVVGAFVVGANGGAETAANSLVISNSGTVLDGNGYVGGAFTGSGNNNNSALVTGSNSVWSNSLSLYVGTSGNGNSLTISNGGKVLVGGENYPAGSYVGRGNSNSVWVTGNGSIWSNDGGVTFSGLRNSLVISSGGSLICNSPSFVGGSYSSSSGSSNSVLVTGSGSVWTNSAMDIGHSGAGNSLVISNGGAVVTRNYYQYDGDQNSVLGYARSGSNNSVVVTGNGSVWNDEGYLYVGHGGSGNSLVIRDGGRVVSSAGFIGGYGCDVVSSNNSVLVTDTGSVWTSGSRLDIDGCLPGNSLVVSNGGKLVSGRSNVGSSVLVTGNDSVWTNSSTLTIAGTLTFNSGTISANPLLMGNNIGVIKFNGGVLNSAGTGVTNMQQFVVGNGTNSATFHLLGGEHSFADGLRIRTNAFLTGCGTINGNVVVDAGGTVLADCGGTLTFTDNVTNNGVMMADNGSVLESSGMLVNNGTILLLDSSTANFHGTFINNGTVMKPEIDLAIERDGTGGLFIHYTGAPDVTYRLQRAASVTGTWSDLATNTAPASGLIEYHEASPPPGQAFYRTVQP